MVFDREELDCFLVDCGAVGFFNPPITLKSGRPGYYYINIRDAISSRYGLRKIAGFVYDFVTESGLKPDKFIGVPAGATPIGHEATSMICYLDPKETEATILREKVKDHGDPKDKYSVGPMTPDKHVILVEDVSTTGGSGETYIMSLQEAGVLIDKFLSVASRLEIRDEGRTVAEAYKDKYNIDYACLTDATTLLPKAFEKFNPPKKVAEDVENYFKKYCSVQLKLLP